MLDDYYIIKHLNTDGWDIEDPEFYEVQLEKSDTILCNNIVIKS